MTEIERKTILVVEDEQPLLRVIVKDLEEAGLEPIVARTAPRAVELLKTTEGIDAVWLDHYLSGEGTGLDVVSAMKEDSDLSRIPVFLVSNTASDSHVDQYKELGITEYFVKLESRLQSIVNDIVGIIR